MTGVAAIDIDEPGTWPEATRRWPPTMLSSWQARRSTPPTSPMEKEDELRETFGERKLLAYHCTRLLPHELKAIRSQGLRLLDQALVCDRIAAAAEQGSLLYAVRECAETRNVYATGNLAGREQQICSILGRSAFDEDAAGCNSASLAHVRQGISPDASSAQSRFATASEAARPLSRPAGTLGPWWKSTAWIRYSHSVRWSTSVLRHRTRARRSNRWAGGM